MIVLNAFEIAYVTDIGCVRQGNEDNYYVPDPTRPFVDRGVLLGVADGMGGHNAGEVAAQVAVETLGAFYENEYHPETVLAELAALVTLANEKILKLSSSSLDLQGLGTTLTAMLLHGNRGLIAHVGDCRLYKYRGGCLYQETDDHSLVMEAVREGILTMEQARVHPQRNIITRALGTRDDLEVDSLSIETQPGDVLILCSDGLHGMLEDFEIQYLIEKNLHSVDLIATALVRGALQNGGSDNVTVVIARVPGGEVVKPVADADTESEATADPSASIPGPGPGVVD